MNHACECGHEPSEHYGDTGGCEHLDADERFCNCPLYTYQGDN